MRTSMVQPAACNSRRHSASPHLPPPHHAGHEKQTPSLTFSLTSSQNSDPADRQRVLDLTLIRAEGLNRAHVSHACPNQPKFAAEGLCARIYKKQMDMDSDASERERNVSMIQTPVFKSDEETCISFPQQSIRLLESEFPIRVSLYDVDKNQVRFSLGHTLIMDVQPEALDSAQTVIVTQDLCPTICSAKRQHTHSR